MRALLRVLFGISLVCSGMGEAFSASVKGEIRISTPTVQGGIALQGGRISWLDLEKYTVKPKPSEEKVKLLSHDVPQYYPQTGWVKEAEEKLTLPDDRTVWTTEDRVLDPQHPVTLSWQSPEGALFKRTFSIDEQYVITVKDQVVNGLGRPFKIALYGCIRRQGPVETAGYFVLHEGLVGVIQDKLVESSYKDLVEKPLHYTAQQPSWFGFTDKYWLTALIPQPQTPVTMHGYGAQRGELWYQADFVTSYESLEPQQAWSYETRIFAGPKILSMLDQYEVTLGIPKFDLAIDFGWFYFLTKPLFQLLNHIQGFLGGFGWAILLLTVFMKALFFPLANKSYRAMGRMKKLQPEIERLKALYGDDRIKMNQALMEVYRQHQVNPMAGCLPMLVQIPVFFALYKVLFVTIEMRHAPFIGWIQDLSVPDPSNLFTLFGLIPWSPPAFLHLGVWPCLMGATMFFQQKMNPQPADPIQQKMMMFLPLIFTFTLGSFPVGLVIYWAWSNVLSIAQQWLIGHLERKAPVKHSKKH